jgi:hypothetical protein
LDGTWKSLDENTEKFTSHDGNVFITFYKSTETLLIQGKEPYKTDLIKLLKGIATAEDNTRLVLNDSTAIYRF